MRRPATPGVFRLAIAKRAPRRRNNSMARNLTALILSLLLAALGIAFAAAPQMGHGTAMVICAGGTMTTIVVDADGNEVEELALCPDHALAKAVLVDEVRYGLPTRIAEAASIPLRAGEPAPAPRYLLATPRGPPSFV